MGNRVVYLQLEHNWEFPMPLPARLIDRLVLQGLIERTEDPADRRAKCLTITNKGKALVEREIATRAPMDGGINQQTDPRAKDNRYCSINNAYKLCFQYSGKITRINNPNDY